MKASLKALTAVVALAVAVPTVQAQDSTQSHNGMRQGGGRMMEMMLKEITLDAGQKTKIEAIQTKYMSEMPPREAGQRPDSASMAKRREVMMKEQDEIRAVLTPDQQKTFDKNVAEMKERMQHRGQGDRGRN